MTFCCFTSRRALLVVAGVALVASAFCIADVAAVGCGIVARPGESCTDAQCSRRLSMNVSGPETAAMMTVTYCVRGAPAGGQCVVDSDCYLQLRCDNNMSGINPVSTCVKASGEKVAWQGYTAVAVAVVAFGSNFIPARRIEIGNGLYFQFFMSTAILCAGFVVQMVRGAAFFYPYAMLGGMLWTLGNTFAMPALKLVSMGLAVSLWGGSNMMFGWASGHFGFWGIDKEEVKVNWISYVGLAFSAVGVVTLGFVKKSTATARRTPDDMLVDDGPAYGSIASSGGGVQEAASAPTNPFERVEFGEKEDISDYLTKGQMRALGIVLAVSSGCFFGINFDPPTLLIDQFAERSRADNFKYSPNGLDYVFSHFFGIFVTALAELVIFTGVDTFVYLPSIFVQTPYSEMILPGFISGIGWAIGQISWFIANDNLGLVVSFPIVTLGPSIVASAWSVFLFREIRGMRNYILLAIAFVMLAVSATCTVFARNGF